MNRLEWILGIILVGLLVIVAVLAGLFWLRPNPPITSLPANSAAAIAARADDIAPTAAFAGQTAKIAFATAQRTAVAWQGDVVLLSAMATWNQGASQQQLLNGETTWGFTFYSPGAGAIATVSVIEDQASLITTGTQQEAAEPLNISGWNLDSREAIEHFLHEGGATFMEDEGVTTLTMMLTTEDRQQNGRIEWLISLFATESGHSWTARIDATSGELLELY